MKTYKKFISELYNAPVVNVSSTGYDTDIPEIKNELNRNLDLILSRQFVTVEEAIHTVRKLLSNYNLDLPQVDIDDVKEGSLKLDVNYNHTGMDEFDGEFKPDRKQLIFSFKLIDGLYKCIAELV